MPRDSLWKKASFFPGMTTARSRQRLKVLQWNWREFQRRGEKIDFFWTCGLQREAETHKNQMLGSGISCSSCWVAPTEQKAAAPFTYVTPLHVHGGIISFPISLHKSFPVKKKKSQRKIITSGHNQNNNNTKKRSFHPWKLVSYPHNLSDIKGFSAVSAFTAGEAKAWIKLTQGQRT